METGKGHLTEACYGALRHHGQLKTSIDDLRRGERCVMRTDRGVEVGVITREPYPPPDGRQPEPVGEVVRRVDADDEVRMSELLERARREDLRFCRDRIEERGLQMRLVHVEPLFGGSKIVFYFVADGRVDFRELVKDLARHFRTRIELRQIGVRDEAKILGDDEYCGRELCCLTWMREILPVTMRMAKNQKSTLDPNKISGRCGRLKCCLRFEDEAYCEIRARMPRVGRMVMSERGAAKVLAIDVMSAIATLQLETRERFQAPVAGLEPYPPDCGACSETSDK